MFKRVLLCMFLMASMVLWTNTLPGAGGRSYSSGGSRSYSSGSSRSSFSSGSSRSSFSGSRPSSSSGRSSFSSGSSRSSGSSGKSFSSGSGKSYSSGSSKSSGISSGKTYSSGSGSTSSSNSSKPSSSGFNTAMSNSAKRAESQKRYQAATQPKSTYTSKGSDGKVVQQTIKPDSPEVQTVRKYVTHERYVTYDNRANTFYGGYTPTYYHDPFSPFLMGWLFSDALNTHQRALWMYNHQSDMDQTRYKEMLAKDAKLQAEIDQLKAQKVAVDPSYVPPEMAANPDLMYNKDFVNASYNPVEVPTPKEEGSSGVGTVVSWIVTVLICGLGLYILFVREY